MKRDPLDFWKKYELLAKTNDLSNYNSGICRFCKKSEPEVSFSSRSHIIPELMGENDIIGSDECDQCNALFSKYESHLSKMFTPYITMLGIKGKKKIPGFQSRSVDRDEDSRTLVYADGNNRKVYFSNLDDYKLDQEKMKLSIRFRNPPLIPHHVYKALVKIGISLAPKENLAKMDSVCQWLIDDAPVISFPMASMTVLLYKQFMLPYAELYRAKRLLFAKSFMPEYTLVLGFGNIVLQIGLPMGDSPVSQKINQKKPLFIMFSGVMFDDLTRKGSLDFAILDLLPKTTIAYDEWLHFSFKEGSFGIEQTDK